MRVREECRSQPLQRPGLELRGLSLGWSMNVLEEANVPSSRSQTRQSLRPAKDIGQIPRATESHSKGEDEQEWLGHRKLAVTWTNIKVFPLPWGQEELSSGAWEGDRGGLDNNLGGE